MNRVFLQRVLLGIVALALCVPLHIALSELIDDTMIAPSGPPTLDALRAYYRDALTLSPRLLLACCVALVGAALLCRFSRWWAVHRAFAVVAAWASAGVLYFAGEHLFVEPGLRSFTLYDFRSACSLVLGGILAGLVFYFVYSRHFSADERVA